MAAQRKRARGVAAIENLNSGKVVSKPALAFAALIGGNAALALGPMFVRFADTGPVAAGFWRLGLAVPVLFLLALWQRQSLRGHGPRQYGLIIAAGVCFGLDIASWHLGIVQTKAANATLFGNAASLFLVLYGVLLARKMPAKPQALAIMLAFLGGAILMGQSYELDPQYFRGDALSLLAGLLYTGYMIGMQRARETVQHWSALALVTTVAAIPTLIAAHMLGEQIMPQDWTPVLLLALSSQIIGQGLMIYALPHFSPLVIGLALLTQPALAALSGYLAFDERLTGLDVMGGMLVAIALVLVRLPAVLPEDRKTA
jgi:drug/metabolite transporter (DMT)-like permease